MIYSNIESYLNKQGISKRKLAEEIGMSKNGFFSMFNNQTMTVEQLIKICEVLSISPCELFEEKNETLNNSEAERNIHLQQLVAEKEKQIKDKEEIISLLKKQIKWHCTS